MTINVGLVTSDALILGCDSISSITQGYVDLAFVDWKTDEKGETIKDSSGNFVIGVNQGCVRHLVTDVYSGVTKMLKICHSPVVVAVTAGLAKLSNRTIKAVADDFCRKYGKEKNGRESVKAVAEEFIEFVYERYNQAIPPGDGPFDLRPDLSFLIGGYGKNDDFPSLYYASAKDRSVAPHFENGAGGIAWNGQSDGVERLIRGYDSVVKQQLEDHYLEQMVKQRKDLIQVTSRIVNDILEKLGVEMPNGVDLNIPATERQEPLWNAWAASIDYDNMPIQDAIDFVSFLVNLQSGKQKFARGIATVGGRTHVGIVTKSEGFRVINPPKLIHKHTGFGNDL